MAVIVGIGFCAVICFYVIFEEKNGDLRTLGVGRRCRDLRVYMFMFRDIEGYMFLFKGLGRWWERKGRKLGCLSNSWKWVFRGRGSWFWVS